MFFFALLLSLFSIYFLPWWSLLVAMVLFGLRIPDQGSLKVALAGGVANAALAFIQDGRSHGLVSIRVAALFHLPSTSILFLVMFVLGALTALFGYRAGSFLSPLAWRISRIWSGKGSDRSVS